MNCPAVRSRLLAAEHPDRLAAELADHLAGCRPCRSFHARLGRLDGQLRRLPVPPSRGPGVLTARLLRGGAQPRPLSPLARREGGRQKLALAFALAASLLLFAVGWWALPHADHPPVTGSDATYLAQRDQRLAEAHTPGERVRALTALADDLAARAMHSEDPVELSRLARAYTRLVRDDLTRFAAKVTGPDRQEILTDAADRLRRSESGAARRASEIQGPGADSLRVLAAVARAGDLRLRALVRA